MTTSLIVVFSNKVITVPLPRSHLTNKTNSNLQQVKFIATETILILDDSSEKCPVVDDGDMIFTVSPVDSGMGFTSQFVSLKFKMEVSYAFAERWVMKHY